MLGLGNSITSNSGAAPFSPGDLAKLVTWYDFTDLSTMYTDAGSTNVTSNLDKIYRIENKAYPLVGSTAIGVFTQMQTEADRPTYNASANGASFTANQHLLSNKALGNVDTNKLSDTTLNGGAMNVFIVADCASTSVSADGTLFHLSGDDANDRMTIYIDDNSTTDRWQWHSQNNSLRDNIYLNSGQNITTNKELWTASIKAAAPNLYRNGDSSDGGTTVTGDESTLDTNLNVDLSANDTDVHFHIGAKGPTAGLYFGGVICEIIIYDQAHADADRKKVEDYLISKHGIS
tara:strand:+ start:1921 stop:2790 length:870 start_codon:yes stop_codon:yes gene_type:complete